MISKHLVWPDRLDFRNESSSWRYGGLERLHEGKKNIIPFGTFPDERERESPMLVIRVCGIISNEFF